MDTSNRPVLSISLLVSNGRLDTIRKCMESLIPLRNEVKCELVVVDTGSKDGSIEIAREYADLVVPFTWCNDFSAARNTGLQKCTGEWFLYLDDDEWFDDVTELIRFFKSGEYKNYEAGWYIQRNYDNFEGTTYTDFYAGRMSKLTDITRFEGKIHEYLAPLPTKVKQFEVFVHHYGYVYRTEEDRQNHLMRNLVLEEAAVAENPEDIRMCCQLVQEYRCARRYEAAERLCQTTLANTKYGKDNSFVQYLMVAIPKILAEQEKSDLAIQEFNLLENKKELNVYARLSVWMEELILYAKGNKHQEAAEVFQKLIMLYESHDNLELGYPIMDFGYYLSAEMLRKALKIGICSMVNEGLIELALKYAKKIDWNGNNSYTADYLGMVFGLLTKSDDKEVFTELISKYFIYNPGGELFLNFAEMYWNQFPRYREIIAKSAASYSGEMIGFWKVLCLARKHYNGESLQNEAIAYYTNEGEKRYPLLETLFFENREALPIVLENSDLEDWSQLCSLFVNNRDVDSLVNEYNDVLKTEALFDLNKKAYYHVKCSIIAEKIMLLFLENNDESIKKSEKNADIYSMETLRATLGEYVFHMTKYSDEIYRSELFDDELCCLLPKNLQFVKWIAKAYQNEDDFSAWGQSMKKAAKAYPVFLPVVRMLINERADKEKNKKSATSHADELQKLSIQMKQLIETYIQNGQYAEAKQLLDEVEQIMPNEDWVRELHTELL